MYYHSVWNFGVGNTINSMAAIRRLSELKLHKIPCYFDLDHVRDCFLDCDFIEILDKKPQGSPLFTSALTNTSRNDKPDYQHIYEQVTGEKWNGQRCYVDEPKEFEAINNFCSKGQIAVFIQGSGNESKKYLDTKTIPDSYFINAVKVVRSKGLTPVFVGSENDLKRNKWAKDMACIVGDIRKALAIISRASLVYTNDSGFAHAAGAMNKNLFVLWKNTQAPRCFNSGENTKYFFKSEWDKSLDCIYNLNFDNT